MEDWISAFSRSCVDWTVLQALRHVARAGSFRAAAAESGVSINTLRGRVARAERIAARPLLMRSVVGVEPTVEGRALLDRVAAMAAVLAAGPDDPDESGGP